MDASTTTAVIDLPRPSLPSRTDSNYYTAQPFFSSTPNPMANVETNNQSNGGAYNPVDEKPPVLNPFPDFGGSDVKEKELEAAHPSHVANNAPSNEEPIVIIPTQTPSDTTSNDREVIGTTAPEPHVGSAFVELQDSDEPLSTSPVTVNRHATGTFASGPGTSGPENNGQGLDQNGGDALHQRANTADSQLTSGVKAKITKSEIKDGKMLSKIMKNEAKSEALVLKSAIKELARLQTVQKQASKDEAAALSKHAKTAKVEQKANAIYLKAKATWERAEADLKANVSALEASRAHARATTEELKIKSLEVEQTRLQKSADDREREVKIAELKGHKA